MVVVLISIYDFGTSKKYGGNLNLSDKSGFNMLQYLPIFFILRHLDKKGWQVNDLKRTRRVIRKYIYI